MISSEALKKALSKPSCISISSTANPIPPLDRNRRGLFATRLRQASGTKPTDGQRRPSRTAGGDRQPPRPQNMSAGSARRRPANESSAENDAMTRIAANTAARRIAVIATGSNVSSRITE